MVSGSADLHSDAPGSRAGLAGQLSRALADVLEAERPRWFLWLPVLVGCGIAIYFALPREPDAGLVIALVAAGVMVRGAATRGAPRSLALHLTTAAVVAVVSGLALAKLRTELVRAPVLTKPMPRAVMTGVVELVEPRAVRGARLTVRVLSIEGLTAAEQPRRVRFRTLSATPGLAPGVVVKVKARLAAPSAPALPGDYDFARAAYFMGLGGTGYAVSKLEIISEPDVTRATATVRERASRMLESLRQTIGARVTAALDGEAGAIANALITGERGAITEATNTAFRDSGLFHVLSISGLHMVVMAGAAFFFVRRGLALFPTIALNYPIKKWAAAAALVAALGYLSISGASVATVRSAIMISIVFAAVLLDRPALAMRNIALAALLILIVTPESLLDAGFQMSFAAVMSLVAVYEAVRRRDAIDANAPYTLARQAGRFFGGILLTTLIASLSVAPLAAYHFHRTQQYAMLANLIAIPVCNVLVMPAGLVTLLVMPFGLEAAPLTLMGLGIDVMSATARTVAALPGAVGHVPPISNAALALMVAGMLWLCLWLTRWRILGVALIAAGLVVATLQTGGYVASGVPERGDVIAGRGGDLVAVRDASGQLWAVSNRGGGFELQRWLDNDGDSRTAEGATITARTDRSGAERATGSSGGDPVWRCDAAACVANIKGIAISAVRHPAALEEDCARAAIIVLRFKRPDGACGNASLVLDPAAFARAGTHVISVRNGDHQYGASVNDRDRDGRLTARGPPEKVNAPGTRHALEARETARVTPRLDVTTVAQDRGTRPWTAALAAPARPLAPPRPKTKASYPGRDTDEE